MKKCIYLDEQIPNRMASWVLLVGFSALLPFFLRIALTGGVAQAWIIAFMLMCA